MTALSVANGKTLHDERQNLAVGHVEENGNQRKYQRGVLEALGALGGMYPL